jgi:hypothetical protein
VTSGLQTGDDERRLRPARLEQILVVARRTGSASATIIRKFRKAKAGQTPQIP